MVVDGGHGQADAVQGARGQEVVDGEVLHQGDVVTDARLGLLQTWRGEREGVDGWT